MKETHFQAIELTAEDAQDAAQLWHLCELTMPYNDPIADFNRALQGPSSTVLGIRNDRTDELIATVMVGYEGHRGWMYYVAVHPQARGRGLGKILVKAAEDWLDDRGMPKAMLMVRATNEAAQGFYRALGYETSTVTVMQRWL